VSTTKLTRKEIIAEDPVHEMLVRIVEQFKNNGKLIALGVAAIILLAAAIYFGMQIFEARELKAQEQLGKGLEIFHGQIAADAPSDPYAKGQVPVFKTDNAKYQAAAKEFSALASRYGDSKTTVVARYYLALTQLQLSQKKDAIQNLESVAANSRVRDISYLAKKVLAREESASKNYKQAADILAGMIKDPQCSIPKEDLSIELSHVLIAQGKRSEAIKVLSDANTQGPSFSRLKQMVGSELDKLQKGSAAPVHP
jgi:predicted negative regulator of RcsB-dependent stress response